MVGLIRPSGKPCIAHLHLNILECETLNPEPLNPAHKSFQLRSKAHTAEARANHMAYVEESANAIHQAVRALELTQAKPGRI